MISRIPLSLLQLRISCCLPAAPMPLLIGMCFLGSVQIFFIGLVGEYILAINSRVMRRPLVIEEERINFETENNEVKEGSADEA